MEKKDLPKLETEGFVTRESTRLSWKQKVSGIASDIGFNEKRKRSVNEDEEIDLGYKRLLAKTGVCAAVAITILIISSVSTPASADVSQAVNYVVNHEFDIDEDIGRLKFVEVLDEETESVFSALPDAMAVYPADGSVVTAFGEGGATGVRLSAQSSEILSIAKGTVVDTGKIGEDGYVEVELDSGETVVYYNLTPCVQEDDIVLPGQAIGEISDDYLYVEMKDGNTYVDPIAYIKERVGTALQ